MEISRNRIEISDKERDQLIECLVNELPVLRTKLGLSQDELGNLIGITRQTYSAIETKKRKMSWGIYLSLLFVFDNNDSTHEFLHKQGIFPPNFFNHSKVDHNDNPLSPFINIGDKDIWNELDEKALHSIETVIMVEYARCNDLTGETVVKAFDGKRLTLSTDKDIKTKKSLDSIKKNSF